MLSNVDTLTSAEVTDAAVASVPTYSEVPERSSTLHVGWSEALSSS